MSNLRKLLAIALASGDLSDDPLQETSLDRIGAMAFSDPLGSKLWRLKWANDAGSWKAAVLLLTKRTHKSHNNRPAPATVQKICDIALREWLDDQCAKCGGRGVLLAEHGVKHVCTTCEGAGQRRHSDQARMRAMGFDRKMYDRWESKFALAHSKLSEADTATARDIAKQLRDPALEKLLAKMFDNAVLTVSPAIVS